MNVIRRVWTKISQSEFSRNVSGQILGTGISQILPFLATPLLTRLYSEEDFAVYTSFFAVASIFAVGVGGKYHLAIVLPEKEIYAKRIFTLSIYITVAYALFLTIMLPFFQQYFSTQMGTAFYYIPLYVLLFGIWTSFINLSIRHKTFTTNAISKVLQAIGYIVTAIVLGFSSFLFYGLVLAKIAGTMFSAIFLFQKSGTLIRFTSLENLKQVAAKYKDYPKFGIWPALLNTISLQALVLILGQFYSRDDLGYYGLTFMVLSAPLSLIGASYKDVFYQRIAVLVNSKDNFGTMRFFRRSAFALLVMGIPICLVLYFFGEPLFSLIFGQKWGRSGEFASILAISFLVKLVVSPLSSIFNATNTLRTASKWQSLYFISTFTTLGIFSYVLEVAIENLLFVYVIHECILYGLYLLLQYKTLKSFKID